MEKKLITYSGAHTRVQIPRAGSPVPITSLGSPMKDVELTDCSQFRLYLELGKGVDTAVGHYRLFICSTELLPAVPRLKGRAGECRLLQWCLVDG